MIARPSDIAQRMAQRRTEAAAAAVQIFAAGMRVNDADRQAGFDDGLAGRHWSPGDRDDFSYALGFASGRDKARRSKGG